MTEKELLELKEKIEEAKSEVSRLEGSKEHLESELKEKWGFDSIKDAKKGLRKLEKEINKLDSDIEEKKKEIEGAL